MGELWINIAHTSGAKIYSLLVGLFTLFITARLLGPEGRGQVATINTWVGLFGTFVGFSLGQVALHRMAGDREYERFGGLFGSLLLLAVLFSLMGWIAAIGWYWLQPKEAFKGLPLLPLAIGFLTLPFIVWEQYGSSLLTGLEQLSLYNRWQIIGRTLSILVVVALVSGLGMGVAGVMCASFLGQVIVAIGGIGCLFGFARSKNLVCIPNKMELKALITGGVKLHLNAVGSFLFTSANILILNYYHGAEQTAYFQLATQLLAVLMIIPQAATMAIYGKVTGWGVNAAWSDNKRLLIQTTLLMVVLGLLAAICAPWGIVLLAGDFFKPAVTPFQWMLPGLIGMTFSCVMAPQWIGRGYFWQAAGLTFLVGLINLASNFLLIPEFGMQGAIYAFLGTYAVSIVGNGLMALKCETISRGYK
ncbi:MAG: oligosaccharide flippase family protein [Mucilaginibacter sp.]